MKHTVFWFVITFKDGEKESFVVDDTCDTIQVFGRDQNRWFEAEAYHLASWCQELGFKLEQGKLQVTLPVEE